MTTSPQEKVRVGIAGTGKIIPEAVAAMQETGWDVTAIWGRHPDKARPLAERFGIPKVTESYADLLASGIDFVYIGLVNPVHYEYAMTSLEAGVNVLVEKPFCSSLEQAGILADKAREKGLFLFETISNIYLPAWAAVREHLPRIGTIKLFQADFSQFSSRYDDYLGGVIGSAFDPACEGGALRDLNIYNLHLAVSLFGTPQEVIFRATRGYNGIDTSGTVLLVYPGHLAVCTAAKDSGNPSGVTVQGDKGWLRIEGMPNLLPSLTVSIRGSGPEHYAPNRYANRLCHEFDTFRTLYIRRDRDAMLRALDHTLAVMNVLSRT